MDSRLRGNDVVFGGAAGDEESRSALKASQSEILRGFYPEHPERDPSLRSGWQRRVRNDKATAFFAIHKSRRHESN